MLKEILRTHLCFLIHNTVLPLIKFNNCVSRCLNGPRHLLYSATILSEYFELLHVYEPGFNTDQYGSSLSCFMISEGLGVLTYT